jgi:hypothetical protein
MKELKQEMLAGSLVRVLDILEEPRVRTISSTVSRTQGREMGNHCTHGNTEFGSLSRRVLGFNVLLLLRFRCHRSTVLAQQQPTLQQHRHQMHAHDDPEDKLHRRHVTRAIRQLGAGYHQQI